MTIKISTTMTADEILAAIIDALTARIANKQEWEYNLQPPDLMFDHVNYVIDKVTVSELVGGVWKPIELDDD